ncbi:MAG: sulfatase-like hydrolase/transferase, partial [bacterium]
MPRPAPHRPNVVLINVDQWRGDCLGVAGHPVVATPYLDQFALDGVRCTRAYAATPVCIPARASLYTGLTPRTHGRVGYRDGVPWPYPVTIAGEFTRHGYQTQAIGKLHVFPARSQFGFQHVILHDGYLHATRKRGRGLEAEDDYLPWLWKELGREADYFDHGLNCNSVVARPWDKAERLHPTNFVVTQGLEFLRRRDPGKPFFLFLSFHRPHPPYDPPVWAFEQYLNEPMPDPPLGDWADAFAPRANPRRPDAFVGKMDPRLHPPARAGN